MRIWEGIQHAIDSGFVPFVLSAGDRRGVKMNTQQIIQAVVIALVTAGCTSILTSYVAVSVLESKLVYIEQYNQETRSELKELRHRVDSFHTRGAP